MAKYEKIIGVLTYVDTDKKRWTIEDEKGATTVVKASDKFLAEEEILKYLGKKIAVVTKDGQILEVE